MMEIANWTITAGFFVARNDEGMLAVTGAHFGQQRIHVSGFGAIADRPFEQVRVADTAKSGSLMGWQPVTPLEEGLERTVDWYRRQLRTSSG